MSSDSFVILNDDDALVLVVPAAQGVPGSGGPVGPGSGITQGQADSRYIKMSQIDQPLGVAGLDANTLLAENELPLPPVTLTVLFTNQMT